MGKEFIPARKNVDGDEQKQIKLLEFTWTLAQSSFVQEVMAIIQEFLCEIVFRYGTSSHIRDLQHIYNIFETKSYQRNAR